MTHGAEDLWSRAARYADDDPDPATRAAIRGWLSAGDQAALAACFATPLTFGTAGLRGLQGPGPACMNRRIVALATAGLCVHLRATLDGALQRGLCIGYDARRDSRAFAEEAAAVAAGQGLSVRLFRAPGPTPLLAFAVRHFDAAGGIMITASHNPKAYNGYKVYNAQGAQLVAPEDQAVSARMAAVASVRALPRVAAEAYPNLAFLDEDVYERYLQALFEAAPAGIGTSCVGDRAKLRVAYTPLHGVAGSLCQRALRRDGFSDFHVEPTQDLPDPEFPTTPFPNPEEPGTMDAVFALAEQVGAELALANDPDGDRLAVAARDRDGVLRSLSGGDVGVLLTDAILAQVPVADRPRALVCYSLVTTPLAGQIARAYGARPEVTLTGFKWICNRALALEARGYFFALGFEEALGYAVGTAVRDKDGIAAAVLVARLAAECVAQGVTLWERLEHLNRTHGCIVSGQHAVTLQGPDGAGTIARAMARVRAAPPPSLGALPCVRVTDLRRTDPQASDPPLPKSDLVVLQLAGGHRVCLRPSGTEPKLKIYVDVCVAIAPEETLTQARERAGKVVSSIGDSLIEYLNL